MKEVKLQRYKKNIFKYSLDINCMDDSLLRIGSDIEPVDIGCVEFVDTPDLSLIGAGGCSPFHLKVYLISQDKKGIIVIKKECKHLGSSWEDCVKGFELYRSNR
ncbi:MAG: hypothetical protein NKF70_14700 [Methanobacterium sp. ERen5]|nr:MAG: hypothetical protein NKF70_14700 [Methanobacterium sp. ERen5]